MSSNKDCTTKPSIKHQGNKETRVEQMYGRFSTKYEWFNTLSFVSWGMTYVFFVEHPDCQNSLNQGSDRFV
jgi:hypothetical protein